MSHQLSLILGTGSYLKAAAERWEQGRDSQKLHTKLRPSVSNTFLDEAILLIAK